MRFKYMDPNDIISVVVVLIVLAVGIYAFFVTVNSMPVNRGVAGTGHPAQEYANNSSDVMKKATTTAGTVFNILGIVITIGAIMSIIGVIYGYLRPKY